MRVIVSKWLSCAPELNVEPVPVPVKRADADCVICYVSDHLPFSVNPDASALQRLYTSGTDQAALRSSTRADQHAKTCMKHTCV